MFVTQISCYIQCSVITMVSHNCGRSWNVLAADTGKLLYTVRGGVSNLSEQNGFQMF
jgi:hypothetical protein